MDACQKNKLAFDDSEQVARWDFFAHLSEKGDHVMLTERKQLDVLHNDHVLDVLVEDGALDHLDQILVVALSKVADRSGRSLWRLEQSLAVHILANAFQNLDVGLAEHRYLSSVLAFFRIRCLVCFVPILVLVLI